MIHDETLNTQINQEATDKEELKHNAAELDELYEVISGLEQEIAELKEKQKEDKVEKDAKSLFCEYFEKMQQLAEENEWGECFSYNRAREIHMANFLGHQIAKKYSGADAMDENNQEVEYKATITKDITATYNGISVYETWEDQERYLRDHKIGKYKRHFYARYSGYKIVELYELSGDAVLDYILPKLQAQFSKDRKNKKDPRFGVSIPKKYIHEVGKKIFPLPGIEPGSQP